MTHHENQCGYDVRTSQGAAMNIIEVRNAIEMGRRVRLPEWPRGLYWRRRGDECWEEVSSHVPGSEPMRIDAVSLRKLGRADWEVVPRKETVGDLERGDVVRWCPPDRTELVTLLAHSVGYVCLDDLASYRGIPNDEPITYLGHIDSIDPAVLLGKEGS